MTLDSELRRALKLAVSEHLRARILPDPDVPLCRGCGVELDVRTVGCRTCMWRHRARKQRGSSLRYVPAEGQGRRSDLLWDVA